MKISVIITVRNASYELAWTLYAIKEALIDFEHEILLVGNVEPGPIYEGLKKNNELDLRFVKENTPGCWPARRTGLANAKGDIVIIADAHIYPIKDCLSYLINGIISKQIDMIFPWQGRAGVYHTTFYKTYADDDERLWSFIGRFTEADYVKNDKLYYVPGFQWCLVAFRREDYERLGGMPEYFMGMNGGEMYMSLKYWMNDLKVAVHPLAKNIHMIWNRPYKPESIARNLLTASYALGGLEAMKKTEAILRSQTHWEIDQEVVTIPQKVLIEKHLHTLDEIIKTKPWRILNAKA